MKKLSILLSVLLFSISFAQVSTDGMVAYYPFNGNANDESGNGLNGTVYGAIITTDRFGDSDKAYSFNGTDNYIEVPDNPLFNFNVTYSISLFFNVLPNNGGYLIFKGDEGGDPHIWLAVDNSNHNAVFAHEDDLHHGINSNGRVDNGNWIHFVAVKNADTLKTYIDGELKNEKDFPEIGSANTNRPFRIGVGGNLSNSTGYFTGLIDDIRIYERALSEEEIMELYEENGWQGNHPEEPLELADIKIQWHETTPFSVSHGEINAELIDRKIYIPGGGYYGGSYNNPALSIYDVDTDTWTTGASMPTAKAGNMSTTVLFDKLYCVGGEGPYAGRWSPEVEEYDPAANNWTYKASWSPPRRDAGLVALDGKLYAIGGHPNYSVMSSDVDVYDHATNSWSKVSNYPITIDRIGAVAYNGKIYAFGGSSGSSQSNRVHVDDAYVYDPAVDEWSALANLPSPRSYTSLAVYKDKIYIIGGVRKEDGKNLYLNGEVLEYSPDEDIYRLVECEGFTTSTIWAYGDVAPVVDDEVILISSSAFDPVADTWVFTPKVQRGLFITPNQPPIAISKDINKDAGLNCEVIVTPQEVDNGSYDPDGHNITLSLVPEGSYPLGEHEVNLIVSDGTLSDTASCIITVTGGSGTIAGSVTIDNMGLEGVIVKLLEDQNPEHVVKDTLTDASGQYNFEETPLNDYQVMIVVPLGYSVNQNFVLTTLECGATNIIDFVLSEEIVSNDARGKGYWKHQFDVYVDGKGKAHETEDDLNHYIEEVHARYTPYFPIFSSDDTFEEWQTILSVEGNSGMEAKAKAHLGALLMNIMSQKVAQYEIVTEDDYTAGDVLTYVSELLPEEDFDPDNDELAKDLAEKVNEQQTIATGLVNPSRKIMYKAGADEPVASSEQAIPKSFALYQNYPNPFNPVTSITFDLPEAAQINIAIYDIQGRRIADIFDRYTAAGRHTISYNASYLSSGIYYYKMSTDKFSAVRKMILTK